MRFEKAVNTRIHTIKQCKHELSSIPAIKILIECYCTTEHTLERCAFHNSWR